MSKVGRPRRVERAIGRPGSRIALIGCGLDFLALCVVGGGGIEPDAMTALEVSRELEHRGVDTADCTDEMESLARLKAAQAAQPGTTGGSSSVLTAGRFSRELRHDLTEWRELRDVPLRQLACGAFHACAVTKRGQLYTFGCSVDHDISNGNLLGTGDAGDDARELQERHQLHPEPRGARMRGLARAPALVDVGAPVGSVSCSTYSTIAITVRSPPATTERTVMACLDTLEITY